MDTTSIQDESLPIWYFPDICWHCGHCAYVCPADAIESNGGEITIDYDTCIGCTICAIECPAHALVVPE